MGRPLRKQTEVEVKLEQHVALNNERVTKILTAFLNFTASTSDKGVSTAIYTSKRAPLCHYCSIYIYLPTAFCTLLGHS